jgi:UDP-N-acetylglucosamine/UDP-N-acetylgalactosamine diphosphorylase
MGMARAIAAVEEEVTTIVISEALRQRLQAYGQGHLLDAVKRLDQAELAHFVAELECLDLAELRTLYARREQKDALPERHRVRPLPAPVLDTAQRQAFAARGTHAFRRAEVAFLVVAGGQGTRLGFDYPKGMFPIGPVSKKSLFQIHAEKLLALRRRFGASIPLLIMTSRATDVPTRQFFAENQNFGLPEKEVWFFCQGTMPALDLVTGRLLLEAPGQLCLSPNGHGGTITGLDECGIFERLQERGIRTISYFQVDNPLTNLADYLFLGRHLAEEAEVSSKVLPKTGPMEKVGNFLLIDGRCSMIEYSDLPAEWAHETDEKGRLTFWAGNPAIHLFDIGFLRKIMQHADRLPWHLAKKKVPHLHESGETIMPAKENALKFERFIFDVLPHAERWTVLATPREEEFAPVKNKDEDQVDCPATARRMMSNLAARWLRQAGIEVPVDAQGNATVSVEISPLYALDPEELREKTEGLSRIKKDTYISG